MSQENVERTYRAFEAVNRRDLEAFVALMDPDLEFTTRFVEFEGDPHYRGHGGVREWWNDLFEIFPELRLEVLEARSLGDFVIATIQIRGRGGDSDAPFKETAWQASEWRNGKGIWWRTFNSEAEALEAARLRE